MILFKTTTAYCTPARTETHASYYYDVPWRNIIMPPVVFFLLALSVYLSGRVTDVDVEDALDDSVSLADVILETLAGVESAFVLPSKPLCVRACVCVCFPLQLRALLASSRFSGQVRIFLGCLSLPLLFVWQ